jgi:hypothetical protein
MLREAASIDGRQGKQQANGKYDQASHSPALSARASGAYRDARGPIHGAFPDSLV